MPDLDEQTSANQHAGPLAEFGALRDEIDSRFRVQMQFFTLQITFTSAIFGFAISNRGLLGLLLIVPFTSYLICARYIALEGTILRIGQYIREDLSERIPGGLRWEQWWRVGADKAEDRLSSWSVPLLIAFPGGALFALCWDAPLLEPGRQSSLLGRIGVITVWTIGILVTAACGFLVLNMSYKTIPRRVMARTLGLENPLVDAGAPPAGDGRPTIPRPSPPPEGEQASQSAT